MWEITGLPQPLEEQFSCIAVKFLNRLRDRTKYRCNQFANAAQNQIGRPKLSKYLRSLPKLPENYRVLDCFVLRKQERLAQND